MTARFDVLARGVAIPPRDAAIPTVRRVPRGDSFEPAAMSERTRPSVRGRIIATATAASIHIASAAVTTPTTIRARDDEAEAPGRISSQRATRRSKPWTRMASARRNAPRSRKRTGSPNAWIASRGEASPAATARTGMARPVAASGTASVTQ